MSAKKIILASNSPRRRELLQQVGIAFQVIPPQVEEVAEGDHPAQIVMSLSRQKALCVAQRSPGEIVLGADTVVVYDKEILGKPADAQEAFDMLSMLSGRTHQVYTGVTIIDGEGRVRSFYEETEVTMYEHDRQELKAYVATGEPMDKAGAYGIQGRGAFLVERISGDYNNVVGLPVARVYRELAKIQDFKEMSNND